MLPLPAVADRFMGFSVVGVRREMVVMVYVCELTNLPFLVAVSKAKDEEG